MELDWWSYFGINNVVSITASDTSLTLSVAQLQSLAQQNADYRPPTLAVPSGDGIIVSDSYADIHSLTPTEVSQFQQMGVTAFAPDDLTAISASSYVDDVNTLLASGETPNYVSSVFDFASNIEALTPFQLNAAGQLGLGQIVVAVNPALDPDGSLVLSVAQMLALENNLVGIQVPKGDTVTIADTAANLETLTTAEIAELPLLGVTDVAATDRPAVFTVDQMAAFANALVPVVAPPNDPTQNDGTLVITSQYGTGLTFDITLDSSVASAPAGFVADVEAAFQIYADLFTNPVTIYNTVGYGNFGNNAVGAGALGVNQPRDVSETNWTYTSLREHMAADVTSIAQAQALESLPATNPAGDAGLIMSREEAAVLDFTSGTGGSASNPDDNIGITARHPADDDFTTDTSDVGNGYGITGVLEHEISEGMGRASRLDAAGTDGATDSYAPIDLFHYAAAGERQQSPDGSPSYFSIDGGDTDLADWNNHANDGGGDLDDWAPDVPQDSYDNETGYGDNPVSPTDIVLMNALGYDVNPNVYFNAAYIEALTPAGIAELADVAIGTVNADDGPVVLSVAQGVAFNQNLITLGAPAGDTITIADTYANLATLTAGERAALAMTGITGYTLADSAGDIAALTPAEIAGLPGRGIGAIDVTSGIATLGVDQAVALEATGIRISASILTGGVTLQDWAANIATLTVPQIAALRPAGITAIDATDTSVGLTVAQAVALENAGLVVSVPAIDSVTVADSYANLLSLSPSELAGLGEIGVSGLAIVDTAAHIEAIQPVAIANFPEIGIISVRAGDASLHLTVSQAVALYGDDEPNSVTISALDGVSILDTAADVATLPAYIISALPGIGIARIDTSDAAMVLSIAQIEAVEPIYTDDGFRLGAPAGDAITVEDSVANFAALTAADADGVRQLPAFGVTAVIIGDAGANIAQLSADVIAAMPSNGFTGIAVTSGNLALSVAQALALEGTALTFSAAAGSSVTVNDHVATIDALSAAEISGLATYAVTLLISTDGPGTEFDLSVAQVLALEGAGIAVSISGTPGGGILQDSGAAIATLSVPEITALPQAGVIGVSVTTPSLVLSLSQAQALVNDGIALTLPPGGTFTVADNISDTLSITAAQQDDLTAYGVTSFAVNDTGANIGALITSYDLLGYPQKLAAFQKLAALGISFLTATDGSVQLLFDQPLILAQFGLAVHAPTGDTVTLGEDPSDLAALTPDQIGQLPGAGVSGIALVSGSIQPGSFQLDVAQALALETTSLRIASPVSGAVTLVDGTDNFLRLTAAKFAGLASLGIAGSAVVDSAARIAALSADDIDALHANGVTSITANDTDVTLDVAQVARLEADGIVVAAPAGGNVVLADTLANLQSMSPAMRNLLPGIGVGAIDLADTAAKLALLPADSFSLLPSLGITEVVATDTSLSLNVAQARAIAGLGSVRLAAPSGGDVVVADTPAQIETLTGYEINALGGIGVSTILAQGPVAVNFAQVQGLDANLTLSATPGAIVTLTDTAADIEAFLYQATLPPAEFEIYPLAEALQYTHATGIVATDAPVQLSLAEAEQLEAANASLGTGVGITAPTGDGVSIVDSESNVARLDTADLVALAGIGVTGVEVDNPTDAGHLTIAGDITLSIDGAVPSDHVIAFAGPAGLRAGILSVQDVLDNHGTIDGFGPGDIIDLPNIGFDPSAAVTLDPGTHVLTISGNDGTFQLQLDPAQSFPGTASFVANHDSGGGTVITYAPADVSNLAISVAQVADLAQLIDIPTDAPVPSVGVAADSASLVAPSSGSLAVDFTVFLTAAASTDTTIDYTVTAPSAAYLGAGAFAGGLPGGQVVIAAGQTSATVEIDLPQGALGSLPSSELEVSISPEGDDPVFAATAQTTIVNSQVTSPGLIVEDSAARIGGLTVAQIAALRSFGVTGLQATDKSVTLTLAQALTLRDAGLPLTVPADDQVVVSDSENNVEALSAGDLAALAGIGVTEVQLGDLDPTGSLTIAGGITLALDGAVPVGKVIDFAGPGTTSAGTLALDDTPEMQGTIDGFSPVDSIDLTDIAYDPAGTVSLDPSGDNMLDISEDGSTYQLQLDPTQVFLSPPGFVLSQDAAGTGTDISYGANASLPLGGPATVRGGQTVDGVVIGDGGTLIIESDAQANRSVIEAGGVLDASGTTTDTTIENGGTLHLATGTAARGSIYFAPVAESAGGTLEIDDISQPPASIVGFAPGDAIDLADIPYDPAGSATLADPVGTPDNQLVVAENGSEYDYNIDSTQIPAAASFQLAPDGDGTMLTETVPCYCRGTRIRTERGEVAVEALRIGDRVMTQSHGARPVRWLGHRALDASRHPEPGAIWPVLVRAGAFGPNLPRRDLWLSPGHGVVCRAADGAPTLVPAVLLVNGRTIVQVPLPRVEYWHVELDAHDIIFAEGLAAESFLDTGNRHGFANASDFVTLHPDFRPRRWDEACLRIVQHGPDLVAAKQSLLDRAAALGARLTPDDDVHILVDGKRLAPLQGDAAQAAFHLPEGGMEITLCSRVFIPAQVCAGSSDARGLGLCIGELQLDGREIALDSDLPDSGWHGLERYDDGRCWRWTTGSTQLPAGTRQVRLERAGPGHYWQPRNRFDDMARAVCGAGA